MILRITQEPPVEPVSLDQAKAHLRITHDEEDDLIGFCIKTARSYAENVLTWRSFVEREWELTLASFSGIRLLRPPVRDVLEVKWKSADGLWNVLSPSGYVFDETGRIEPAPGTVWPQAPYPVGAVTVSYRAGYPKEEGDPDDYRANIPAEIIQAVLLLTAHFYEMRDPTVIGNVVQMVPFSVEALLLPYRAWGASR